MTAVPLSTVMTNLGTALSGITGLRVFPFPPKSAQPPFAFVVPESIDYDGAMVRGMDRMSLTIYVGVAVQNDRCAWADVVSHAAATDVKAAVDALGQNYRVQRVVFNEISLSAGTYLGAIFTLDVAA